MRIAKRDGDETLLTTVEIAEKNYSKYQRFDLKKISAKIAEKWKLNEDHDLFASRLVFKSCSIKFRSIGC